MFELLRLARQRHRSNDNYRAMQSYIARKTLLELEQRNIDLANCEALELGAGRGGYSIVLHEKFKSFLANDLNPDPFFEQRGIPFLAFDVTKPFPLESESFDLIYCSSLIEHVSDPVNLLRECRRVLRQTGKLYLSFPPFYSLAMVGAHGFQPFHFLGEKVAIAAHNWRRGGDLVDYATAGGNFGLYPLTIADVARFLRMAGFEVTDTYTRMISVNTATLPWIFKDLATWHVCFLAE
jgi:SAM-dependent methyltransferase